MIADEPVLSPQDDLSLAIEAAMSARNLLRDAYQSCATDHTSMSVERIAELACAAEEVISTALMKSFPEQPILSAASKTITSASPFWLLEPLDGRCAFAFHAGRDLPATLLARQTSHVTDLAVVFFPLTDACFSAARGQGAYKNGKRLTTQDAPKTLDRCWIDVDHADDPSLESIGVRSLRHTLRKFAPIVTTMPSHAAGTVRIAESNRRRWHAIVRDNAPVRVKHEAWHIAAPQCVLQEAGGVMHAICGKSVDPFRPEPFIAAANADLARAILRCLG